MKKLLAGFLTLALFAIIAFSFTSKIHQEDNPWTVNQLLEPADLAKIINDGNKENYYIYNIGPAGAIKNSIEIGDGKEENNIAKLKEAVSKLPKDANIVVYCGCCPFVNCPNVRPAFSLLKEMNFTNHRLLNLPKNLKVNWIDHGYPMSE